MSRLLPSVTSSREFVLATNEEIPGDGLATRVGLQDVDEALALYEARSRQGSETDDGALRALDDVACACACWLDEGGSGGAEEGGASRGPMAAARRRAVEDLGRRAFGRLQAAEFERNKAAFQAGALHTPVRETVEGYGIERRQYLASGKRTMPVPGSLAPLRRMLAEPERKRMVADGLAGFADVDYRSFLALPGEALLTFEAWAAAQKDVLHRTRVRFMSKRERLRYLIHVRSGRLFGDFRAPLATSQVHNRPVPGEAIYVVDRYGNLYCCLEPLPADGSLCLLHSSYTTGNTIICGGVLGTEDGRLTYIDNMSGHYKPTREHLHAACVLLSARGVDFSTVRVVVREMTYPDGGARYVFVVTTYEDGRVFLADKDARGSRVEG